MERMIARIPGIGNFVEETRARRLQAQERELFYGLWSVITPTITLGSRELLVLPQEERPETAKEVKELLLNRVAKKYIPGEDEHGELLREVFVHGSLQALTNNGSLKPVAEELGLSWRDCVRLFSNAQEIFFLNVANEVSKDVG